MKLRFVLACVATVFLSLQSALAIETTAPTAMVLDYNSGTVLLEKNADTPLPPASMSKLMTLNMVFEALEDGRLSLDEELPVSEYAMSYGGSTMFLNTRDRVRVEDLIRGVIVLSGNDACVVLAEALAGSEAEFARSMTARAKQLGMVNSTFGNSNGWPHPDQRMSARDLVILAERLIREFPQYYGYFAEREFAFDGRSPANRFNRNPLLKLGIGADGLKTGHTDEAGYGIVGSAEKNGRRVIVMLSGLESEEARADEAEKLMNWAFRQFVEKKIFESGEEVGRLDVWLGKERSLGLVTKQDVTLLLPVTVRDKLNAEIVANTPVPAPVVEGTELAKLLIEVPEMETVEIPLFAAQSIEEAGVLSRIGLSAEILREGLLGWVR